MYIRLPEDIRGFTIPAFAFVFVVLIGTYVNNLSNNNFIQSQKILLSGTARSQASDLERSLSLAFTSTQILAHQIEVEKGDTSHFQSYAKNIMESIGGIKNIQLAPNGVIENIYPLAGNENAIGLNILQHPKYREAALLAITERRMIAVGPVGLVQGGTAVIGRTPIFVSDNTDSQTFWGFASALIMLDDLLKDTGIFELENDGYSIMLERHNDTTDQATTFYKSKTELDPITSVYSEITLPTGSWKLGLSIDIQKPLMIRSVLILFITFAIAVLVSLSIYLMSIRPKQLQQEVEKKTRELKDLAYNDPLTGLPNRRYLNNTMPNKLKSVIENNQHGAFIYFDLDNFKSINDSIGHDIGDIVLQKVAERLSQNCRIGDQVIRLGGDEFAIIIYDATIEDIKTTTKAILVNTQKILRVDHREFKLSTSLGITLFPEHSQNILELMRFADVALYEAKRRGKNQFVIFDRDMQTKLIEHQQEELALARAIKEHQLELHYQPQFDLSSSKVISAETLVRWIHPEKGLILPDLFIPMAEQSGQILELGNYVIRESFEYLKRRNDQGLPPITLHINLSSLQLSDLNLVPYVTELINTYQIPGHYIGFEITETTLLTDLQHAKATLNKLKALGISIAIDDFGTGFSSLGQLKNLPVDLIKIDRSFVQDLDNDLDDKMIVEAIIAMAHKLNTKVIAEGIETAEQLEMLKAFHCDLGQGYLISRPIPEKQFNAFSNDIRTVV